MIIKIQNKMDAVSVEVGLTKRNILNNEAEILGDEADGICEMAMAILELNPRFKEIVINTELTDDGEDNH